MESCFGAPPWWKRPLSCTRFLWTRHCRIRNREEQRDGQRNRRDGCGCWGCGQRGRATLVTLSMARDEGAVGALAPGQRWSLSRKRDVVLRLMQGEPVEGLSRRLGLPVYKLEEWRQRGLAGIDAGLRERDDDAKERALAEAHRRIGELNMENELLRARLEKPGPLARGRSR